MGPFEAATEKNKPTLENLDELRQAARHLGTTHLQTKIDCLIDSKSRRIEACRANLEDTRTIEVDATVMSLFSVDDCGCFCFPLENIAARAGQGTERVGVGIISVLGKVFSPIVRAVFENIGNKLQKFAERDKNSIFEAKFSACR